MQKQIATIIIKSAAFLQGERIPIQYTCRGEDISPPLTISNIPPESRSLAIIVDDPDAPRGVFVHWVAWNINPKTTVFRAEENIPMSEGKNDFGRLGYRGPCPPPGSPHRYFFKIYALNTHLDLPNGSSASQLEAAMEGHILGKGELMGIFQR